MNKLFSLAWVCSCIPAIISGADLPEGVEKCHYADSTCIIRSINALIKSYPMGIPEIGLPPLDAYYFPDFSLLESSDRGPIWINFRMRDNVNKGFNNATITHVEGFLREPNQKQIVLTARLPRLLHEATYDMEGKFLHFAFNTTGRLSSDHQNFRITLTIKTLVEYRNGKRYLKIYNLKPKMDLDRWIIWLDDLYKENMDVTILMNKVLNDNWVECWNELQPSIAELFTTSFTVLLNKVFENVAYDDMFLNDLDIRSSN
ncbi:protein takeout [Drosophila rhopaloa]|uniref:Protein takeout n=1 Tax=Drosophila rhopaloa TaxID=1041015 RepID=A0A6P4F089_DRORH|nr:protein takeout [Drosophila rhopaloa]